ncbi:unnamed protein product [Adineta steineri]|uniref:Deacetylase sirtuin-type domain-containing protein n=1 Tax=Adineta steineri TaxID=433720 RepID=A0A813P670_9BILA|nr:unnamed protein product [Adineta steineri]
MEACVDKAAELILNSDAILFTSGTGWILSNESDINKDISTEVWPPLLKYSELDFTRMNNAQWFRKAEGNSDKHNTANFSYAFWAYRYNTYNSITPHFGYQIVKQWSEMNHIKYSFNFTGNIDGHWLKSGWNPSALVECYGSIHYMQCINKCRKRLVDTKDSLKFNIDPKTDCVIGRLPHCPYCKHLARPNVLMNDDLDFFDIRLNEQTSHYETFKSNVIKTQAKLLVIELGADTTLPKVRNESASTFIDRKWTANIIRINSSTEDSVVESCYRNKTNNQGIEINLDPLTALTLLDKVIKKKMKQ